MFKRQRKRSSHSYCLEYSTVHAIATCSAFIKCHHTAYIKAERMPTYNTINFSPHEWYLSLTLLSWCMSQSRIKINILKCIKNIIHYLNCDTCSSGGEIMWLFWKNNIDCRGVLSMYLVITLISSSHLVAVVCTYK